MQGWLNRIPGGYHKPALRCFKLASFCIVLAACSCSELVVAPYRDNEFLRNHEYSLGEQYLEVNGLRICYEELGQGEDVVILPGLGTSIDFWQLNLPSLAEQYHVVAVDPPGIGKSDKPDVPYDLQWTSDQILAFMDTRGLQRVSFIGGSMGGHLALLVALRHPERVDKLVLMGSSGAWPRPGFLLTAALYTLWNEAVVADYARRNWPAIYGKMFDHQTPVTQQLLRYQMAIRADAASYALEGRAFSRALRSIFWHSCRDELGQVKRPTLLIWGEADRIHPYDEAACFRAMLPDSRLVVVAGAAHEVMVDQPEAFDHLVLTFLKQGTCAIEDNPKWHIKTQLADSAAAR